MDEEKYRVPSADEILAMDDLPVEIVPVPEWGPDVAVKVRGMSAEERIQYSNDTKNADGKVDIEKATYLAILMGVVQPKFGQHHIPQLRKKSAAALDRITRAWLRLSGIGDEDLLKTRGNS